MTHLILHSRVVHPYNERIWPPLRAMYDLVLLQRQLGRSIDWTNIECCFRKGRQHGLLTLHLLHVCGTLGHKMPIPIRHTGLTRLRWLRRKLLRRWPTLRYFDPVYMFSAVFIRCFRVLRNMLSTPGGAGPLFELLFEPGVYGRIFTDLIEGRGR